MIGAQSAVRQELGSWQASFNADIALGKDYLVSGQGVVQTHCSGARVIADPRGKPGIGKSPRLPVVPNEHNSRLVIHVIRPPQLIGGNGAWAGQ